MVTYRSLLAYAKSVEGLLLETRARHSRFTVRVTGEILEFLPSSTGIPRPEPRANLDRVLERYNQSGSLTPGSYQDVTRNASYLMTLLAMLVGAAER